MPLTIAVTGAHGGAGATSVVLGLASVLAAQGERVLVVDMCPQANATGGLGVSQPNWTTNDVLFSVKNSASAGIAAQAVVPAGSDWPNVWLIPSERALAERRTDNVRGSEMRLRLALQGLSDYDVVLIDAPHSGEVQIHSLVAAHRVLVVTHARSRAINGVGSLMALLGEIRAYFNQDLEVAGIVINEFLASSRDSRYWLNKLVGEHGGLVLQPQGLIPSQEVVPLASSAELPLAALGSSARDVSEALRYVRDHVAAPETLYV